jgi:hypothetical protein
MLNVVAKAIAKYAQNGPRKSKGFVLLKKPYGGIMAALMARPSGSECSTS